MIKVTVLYPNEPDKKFDVDYYVNTHVPMVQRLLGPMGLIKGELEKVFPRQTPASQHPS